jgi:hypothetical protein
MRKFLALYLIVCALLGAACPSSAQTTKSGAGCATPGLNISITFCNGGGGPSFVQGKLGPDLGNSGATTTAATFTAPVGSGHSVVGAVTWSAVANPYSVSVTNDKSNSYTVIDTNIQGTVCKMATFYSINLTNSPSIITATATGSSTFWRIIIDEFSGVASLDQHTGQPQTNVSGTNAMTSGNVTTGSNGELVYGAGEDICNSLTTISDGTGFTATESGTSSDNQPMYGEYLVQPTGGATAATFSPAGSVDTITNVMTFVP